MIRQLSSLEPSVELLTTWDQLAGGNPFRSWPWLASWWEAYQPGRQLLTLAVEDDQSEVIGLIPWFAERRGGSRVIRFLGGGQACSDYLSGLVAEENHMPVASELADWLLGSEVRAGSDQPLPWDRLEFGAIDQQDPFITELTSQMAARGCHIDRRPGPNCWRIDLPASWEEYLALQSKSHRKQIRRVERRSLASGEAQLHTAESPETLEAAWEIFVDLHQRRWKSLGEPGCFANRQMSEFLWLAVQRFQRENKIELHWVTLGGKPVAAELHLVGRGVSYTYQSGIDPTAIEAEPGRIIGIATIKRAIELGRVGFDFLRGDEPYKAHWRATPRPTWNYRVVPPRAIPRLRHGVHRAGEEMKSWVKSGLTAVGVLRQSEDVKIVETQSLVGRLRE